MGETIEPRIQVTPSPATGPLLRELAKVSGRSPAKIIREMLDEMAPLMPDMIEAFRVVKSRPQQARDALQRMATQIHREVAQGTLNLNAALKKKPGRKPGKKQGRGATKAR